MEKHIENLIKYLIHQIDSGIKIYALLDAAKNPEIAYKPFEFFSEWISLYKGETIEALADVAPYLVNLSKDNSPNKDLIQWICQNCWGESCCILVYSEEYLDQLFEHFNQFIIVSDESKKSFYFRFYDPRVLKVYLPTCNEEELKLFFGNVHQFVMEDDSTDSMFSYSLSEGNLISKQSSIIC